MDQILNKCTENTYLYFKFTCKEDSIECQRWKKFVPDKSYIIHTRNTEHKTCCYENKTRVPCYCLHLGCRKGIIFFEKKKEITPLETVLSCLCYTCRQKKIIKGKQSFCQHIQHNFVQTICLQNKEMWTINLGYNLTTDGKLVGIRNVLVKE